MHIPRSIRKLLLGFAVVLVIAIAAFIRFHHPKPVLGVAYAGGKQVILWDSSAEIREPTGTLKYGDKLDILDHFQQQTKVRTSSGMIGWVAESDLLSVDLWQKMRDLDSAAATSPVEAHGATKVISNLHIGPGRETPRLRQIAKGVPVELFTRQPVEVPVAATAIMTAAAAPAAESTGRRCRRSRSARGPKKKTGGSRARIWPTAPPRQAGFSADSSISTCPNRCLITQARPACGSPHGSSSTAFPIRRANRSPNICWWARRGPKANRAISPKPACLPGER